MHSRRTTFLWGMLAGASVMALAASGIAVRASGQAAAPPASSGASSKVVLENARVRVKDVPFPPGARAKA